MTHRGCAGGIGLHHERRHRADDRCFCDAALAVPRKVVHDLAAAGGVPDVDCVLQSEMGCHGREIVCVMVYVMTVRDLCRAAVAAPVVRDAMISLAEKEQHLRVPVVR